MLLVGSLVVAVSFLTLGFYIGNQIGQTSHIRAHLVQTRSQRQILRANRRH